jgi:glycosyltransferase involved in cell wall biosynthesis
MKILHFTPGTGHFHCGSCLRDHALIRALRNRGHEAVMAPLYLPLVTDREIANPELPVLVGGLRLYVQEKLPWVRHLPRGALRFLDSPSLLRYAAKKSSMTHARDLGRMTLGALEGEAGRQWPEWRRVLDWAVQEVRPDVVSLSNSLLCGLAPVLQRELGVPVVVSLQGEDSFLDTLVEPYQQRSWAALAERARSVTRFIAPSAFYAEHMRQRLGLAADAVSVVPNGIETTAFSPAKPDPNWPTIGFFARMIQGKGLTLLVRAFIQLCQRGDLPRVRLKIGGAQTQDDLAYQDSLQKEIHAAGLTERVEWLPNLSFNEKVTFFRDLTVFSVPAIYGEAFGLYVLEALASGVPVVQPRTGAFPEILEQTGGGLLCEPEDVTSLADALQKLLLDEPLRVQKIQSGLAAVRQDFSAIKMAQRFEELLVSMIR